MNECSDSHVHHSQNTWESSALYYRGLISKISHEIRNPLTLISSSLQLLERECPDVKASWLWNQIRQDMQNTIRLLQDISSFSRAGTLQKSSVILTDFLAHTATSCAALMENHGIRFLTDFDSSVSDVVFWADVKKLQEAVTNLLLNAADAVSESNNRLILFSAAVQNGSIFLHIKDSGPGIPGEFLDQLFEPFVTHKPEGTGLGLSIAKTVANLHGGNISVTTNALPPETYSDFCLKLPLSDRI